VTDMWPRIFVWK